MENKVEKRNKARKDERREDAVAVIGGGAAGMFFAARAAERGVKVMLFEKNSSLGRKLAITGKGRCNLTNDCTPDEFIANVVSNRRFLFAAAKGFSPSDTVEYFSHDLGLPLKTERGRRVFPESDKASDVVKALERKLAEENVTIINEKVTDIITEEGRAVGVVSEGGEYRAFSVVVATGGLSYPTTGSTGDGYSFASRLGIKTVKPTPSLVPLVCREEFAKKMQGLTLKNVRIFVEDTIVGKTMYDDFGELLFTHFGLSGPVILSASCHLRPMTPGRYRVTIDLKPALDEQTLDRRILSDLDKYHNRDIINSLDDLLPQKMIPVFIEMCSINPRMKANSLTRTMRKTMIDNLKRMTLTVEGFRPISEAIITAGGVATDEINPKSMESKKIGGLYFIGETLDLDAYTGGFNLQIAFSSAESAAKDIAKKYAIQTENI